MVETITVYKAIEEMRKLSRQGKSFSLVHATYDRTRKVDCKGLTYVRNAILRRAAKDEQVVDSKFKLYYFDRDIEEHRVCWQPLIMFFNEMKVELN